MNQQDKSQDPKQENTYRMSRFLMTKQKASIAHSATSQEKRFTPNVEVQRNKSFQPQRKIEKPPETQDSKQVNLFQLAGQGRDVDRSNLIKAVNDKMSRDRRISNSTANITFGGLGFKNSIQEFKGKSRGLVNQIDKIEEEIKEDENKLKPVQLPLPRKQKQENVDQDGFLQNVSFFEDQFVLVQLPQQLPLENMQNINDKQQEGIELEKCVEDTESKEQILDYLLAQKSDGAGYNIQNDFTKLQFQEDSIPKDANGYKLGKLLLYKSGKIKFQIGEVLYDVVETAKDGFYQELAAINEDYAEISFLTPLLKKFIVIPKIEEFF